MSLHSRIFVPGVSRAAPAMGGGGGAKLGGGFVPPSQHAPLNGTNASGPSASSLLSSNLSGNAMMGPRAPFNPHSHHSSLVSSSTPASSSSSLPPSLTTDAAMPMPSALHDNTAMHDSSGAALASSGNTAAMVGGGGGGRMMMAAAPVKGGSASTFSFSSLPQPPPLAGRSSGGVGVGSAAASSSPTPTLGSAFHPSSSSATTTMPQGANHDASSSSSVSCASHITYCPCCGKRGRFVHEDDADFALTSAATGASLHQNQQLAPPPPPPFDPSKKPPTAFKLYCDAIEPSLVAKKMNMKDRKQTLASGFEALSAEEKASYEAKAAALAKEFKQMKKKLSGGKTGREGDEDVIAVKRTKTSFMLFSDDKRASIAASLKETLPPSSLINGKVGLGDIGRALGEAWKALSEDERKVYVLKAEALKNGAAEGAEGAISLSSEAKTSTADDDDEEVSFATAAPEDVSDINIGADEAEENDKAEDNKKAEDGAENSEAEDAAEGESSAATSE